MVFFVTALKESKDVIKEAVEREYAQSLYVVAPDKWFVSTSEEVTARQVATKLGIIKSEGVSGLVLSVGGYSGRAQPDMWEWLAAQSGKTNG